MTQFRKNNKKSFLSVIMTFVYRRLVTNCGDNVEFDAIVHLMRYPKNIELGDRVYIKSNARLCPCNNSAKIVVGENTTIGYNTIIFSSAKIVIGKNCMIAPNVYIVDSDHGTARHMPMNQQDNIIAEISIGDDVWIAAGAVILKGSIIPSGCVIAANSVVRGHLEPYTIYGGTPARKIGDRK